MWQAAFMLALVAAQNPRVPLEPGLTLTYASAITGQPDWETRLTVARQDSAGITINGAWSSKARDGQVRWLRMERRLPNQDRRLARSFHVWTAVPDPTDYRGSTFYMPSLAILDELKRLGRSTVQFLSPGVSPLPYAGVLQRVGRSESMSVLVNGRLTKLQGIRAQGTLNNPSSPQPVTHMSFVFLDDPAAPWILVGEARNAAGTGRRQLVQIAFRSAGKVEAELTEECRATVYGLYFATGSADLDSASTPALAAIGKTMTEHPDWRVTIVGHTDSIGANEYNLDLSRRRAERVRTALISDYRIAAARLAAEGKGERVPIDDNGTLTGRARNRRVELSRPCK